VSRTAKAAETTGRRTGIRFQDWREAAACQGEDVNLFFPEPGPTAKRDAKKAKAICAGCPVQAECLENALTYPERWGIWGRLSERQRYNMRPAKRDLNSQEANAA